LTPDCLFDARTNFTKNFLLVFYNCKIITILLVIYNNSMYDIILQNDFT
jgi:hypothetical protein